MKHIFALVLYILCGLSATSSVFDWRVARAADVSGDSAVISMPGYADSDWVAAPVPETVAEEEEEEEHVLRKLKPKIPDHNDAHPVAENMKLRKDAGLR